MDASKETATIVLVNGTVVAIFCISNECRILNVMNEALKMPICRKTGFCSEFLTDRLVVEVSIGVRRFFLLWGMG